MSSQERLCGWWRNGLDFGAPSSERPTTAAAETPSPADMGRRKYCHEPDRRMDKNKLVKEKTVSEDCALYGTDYVQRGGE